MLSFCFSYHLPSSLSRSIPQLHHAEPLVHTCRFEPLSPRHNTLAKHGPLSLLSSSRFFHRHLPTTMYVSLLHWCFYKEREDKCKCLFIHPIRTLVFVLCTLISTFFWSGTSLHVYTVTNWVDENKRGMCLREEGI